MNITSVVSTAVTSQDSSSVSPSGVGESNLIASTSTSTYSTPSTFLRSTSSRVVSDISRGSSSGIATSLRSTDTTRDFSTAHSVISASSTAMDSDTGPSVVLGDQTSHVLSTTLSLTPATPSSSTSVLTMPTETPQVPTALNSPTAPSAASPTLPMPVLIGIGAGGGALLLGLVVIAIVILCGCCGAKCRRKQQHGRRNPEAMHSEQTWMEDKNLSGNNLFPLRNGTIKENLNVSTPESVGVSNHGSMHVSSHDIPEQLNTLGGRSPFLPDMQNGSSDGGTLSPRVEAAGTTRTSDPPEPHSLSSPDTIMVQVLPVIVPKEQPVTMPTVQPVTMPTVQPMPAVQPVTIPATQPIAMPTVQPVNLPMVHNDINTRTVDREKPVTYVNQQMLASQQVPILADVPTEKKKKKKPVPAPRPVTHSTSPPHVPEGYVNMAVHPEDQYDVPKPSVAKKQSSPVVSPLSPFSPPPGVSTAAVTRNQDRPVTSTTPSPRATSSEYDIPSGVLCSTKKNKIPPIIGPKPKKSEKMPMAVTESLYDTPKSTNQLVTSPPVPNSGGYYVPINNPINASSSTEFPPSDTYDCPRTHTLPANDIAYGLYDTPKTAYFSTLQPMHKQDQGLYDVPKSTQLGQYIAMAGTKRVPDSQFGDPNLQYDFLMPLSHKDSMAYGSHGINDSDYDVPKSFHHH